MGFGSSSGSSVFSSGIRGTSCDFDNSLETRGDGCISGE